MKQLELKNDSSFPLFLLHQTWQNKKDRKVAEFLAQDLTLEWKRTWIALLSVQFIT